MCQYNSRRASGGTSPAGCRCARGCQSTLRGDALRDLDGVDANDNAFVVSFARLVPLRFRVFEPADADRGRHPPWAAGKDLAVALRQHRLAVDFLA